MHTHPLMYTHTHARTHSCTHTLMHTPTQTHTHKQTHTHSRSHQNSSLFLSWFLSLPSVDVSFVIIHCSLSVIRFCPLSIGMFALPFILLILLVYDCPCGIMEYKTFHLLSHMNYLLLYVNFHSSCPSFSRTLSCTLSCTLPRTLSRTISRSWTNFERV